MRDGNGSDGDGARVLDAGANTVRIFCDFDGTIVAEDVGDAFFERFSGPEMREDTRKLRAGEFGIREVFDRALSRMATLNPETFDAFVSAFSPEAGFGTFVSWTRERGYPLMILSDGLDAYVSRILHRAGLEVAFRANAFSFDEDGTCSIALPYRDEFCTRCGTCKRNQMLVHSADKDVIVYIGDGFSDFCPSAYADIVYAKGELETHCREQNISFRRFTSFDDVRTDLASMCARRSLHRPRRAVLNRQALWSSG